jgi:hypothetical protein
MKNKISKLIFFFLVIVLVNAASLVNAYAASPSTIIDLANSSRNQAGLNTLTVNSQLAAAATAKAQDMFKNGYFAHTSPSGKTPWDFISGADYSYVFAGENLAIGYNDDQELHEAWMNSPTHKANIVNPNFKEIGVAVLDGEYQDSNTIIVVQMFGTQPSASQVQVASAADENTSVTEVTPNNQSVVAESDEDAEKEFSFDNDKTSFAPKQIFSGEKSEFTVAVSGAIQKVEITVDGENFDLASTSDGIYQKEATFDKVGDFPVTLKVTGKSGQTETFDLGGLKVVEKVIQNSNNNNGSAAGFAKVIKDNIGLISSIVALFALAFAVVLYFRYHKTGKLI